MSLLDSANLADRRAVEQLKVAVQSRVGPHAAYHLTLEQYRDEINNALVHRLSTYVLADRLVGDTKDVTIAYSMPASWWQHFKATYGHQWWLRRFVRRWPAKHVHHSKTRSVTFERYATYPHATVVAPLGKPVIFESFKELS